MHIRYVIHWENKVNEILYMFLFFSNNVVWGQKTFGPNYLTYLLLNVNGGNVKCKDLCIKKTFNGERGSMVNSKTSYI